MGHTHIHIHTHASLSIGSSIFFQRSPIFRRFPKCWKIFENYRKLHMSQSPQSRRHERPRSSRSRHSNPGGASCRSSTSVGQMLAAATIKVMDALFGLVARNDAECCKRELLGRSWRRDWAMRNFRHFLPLGQKLPAGQKMSDSMV